MPYLLAGYGSIWLIWIPLRLYTKSRGLRRLSTVFKAVPTLAAAGLAGGACLPCADADTAAWLVFAGLAMGSAADVVIDYRLAPGGLLFFFAHGLYTASFLLLCPPTLWTPSVFLAALLPAAWYLNRYRSRFPGGRLRVGVAAYTSALCALLASALPAPFLLGGARALAGVLGAALFVLSDALLVRNVAARAAHARDAGDSRLRRRRVWAGALSLGCYYTAQTMLALSVYYGLHA